MKVLNRLSIQSSKFVRPAVVEWLGSEGRMSAGLLFDGDFYYVTVGEDAYIDEYEPYSDKKKNPEDEPYFLKVLQPFKGKYAKFLRECFERIWGK